MSMSINDRWKLAVEDLAKRYERVVDVVDVVDEVDGEDGNDTAVVLWARTRLLQHATSAIETASEYMNLLENETDAGIIERARDQDENENILMRYLILKYIVCNHEFVTARPYAPLLPPINSQLPHNPSPERQETPGSHS